MANFTTDSGRARLWGWPVGLLFGFAIGIPSFGPAGGVAFGVAMAVAFGVAFGASAKRADGDGAEDGSAPRPSGKDRSDNV
ncbi:hypothetical protein ACN263_03725 [Micromonospora sp. WMMD729]|uniref:hypothetical protein n=1 Tax=Micromonospora sp. WMMD729 TaxID=3404127 RepID=UPI003BF61C9E